MRHDRLRRELSRAIASLPEVAPAAAGPMERPSGFRHEPAEGPAEDLRFGRLEQQVHVIRHQRVPIQRDLVGPNHLPEMGE